MKSVGIIGGMGPQATIDLYQKIVNLSRAECDQEHIHAVIDSYPQIPDRTAYLKGEGENPLPYILESAGRLTGCFGVDCLCMPCNTAHHFAEQIREYSPVPFISMVESVFEDVVKSGNKDVWLLATDGTLLSGTYLRIFSEGGVTLREPDAFTQSMLMDAIYLTKAGDIDRAAREFNRALERITGDGCVAAVAACTELPVLIPHVERLPVILFDATLSLARRVVEFCYGDTGLQNDVDEQ